MKRKLALSIAYILLATATALGQVSVSPAPVARQQFEDANGVPLAGGKLYTYIAGTTTPQATYTDSTGTVQNTNPIILDSAGRASIWMPPNETYRFRLYDASGNLIWQQDGITTVSLSNGGVLGGTFSGDPVFSGTPTFSGEPTFAGGVKSSFWSTPSLNPASAGAIRLSNNSDKICWRSATDSADVCLYLDGSNVFQIPTALNITGPATLGDGGSLAGTFSGDPTFSGTVTLSGAVNGSALQGTDTKLLTAGTVSGTGTALCTDANGGATTSGCISTSVNQGARVYSTTNLGDPNNTVEALPFNATRFNNGPMWSAANSTRLTAQVAGTYIISGSVNWTAASGGYRFLGIQWNGAGFIAEQIEMYTDGSTQIPQTVTTIWHLSAGDYVELVVNQTSGGTMNLTSSGNYSPEFSAEYVGP